MKTILFGAIIGDMVGSFRTGKTKDFELFQERSRFSADTIMTIAVADALLKVDTTADEDTFRAAFIHSMQSWGRHYNKVRYSRTFKRWLMHDNPIPDDTKNTNGSAMRVSPVGWVFDTVERTRQVARNSAEVSHNTLEAIYGAESVASAIFLARNGKSKNDIKLYIEREFSYDLSRKLDNIRPTYKPVLACNESVPEALISFLESTNFEDTIRNAISLGGDSDTLAAIAGSVAEAFYGIPQNLINECSTRLPEDMREVLNLFKNIAL